MSIINNNTKGIIHKYLSNYKYNRKDVYKKIAEKDFSFYKIKVAIL